jgi:quercetin dioxygenase-like cupin family protein
MTTNDHSHNDTHEHEHEQIDRVAQFNSHPELSMRNRVKQERAGLNPEKRVLRSEDRVWNDNNVQHLIDATNGFDDHAIACFLRRIAPGGESDIHRHNFEAMGYVVKGKGYEIHDGEKIEWKEGDAVFIPANVWHQHVNADPENEAIILLITNWPLLLHLGICTMEPAQSWQDALSRIPAIPDPTSKVRDEQQLFSQDTFTSTQK